MDEITISEFKLRQENNQIPVLIDVRSPAEFSTQHVEGAINIPLSNLSEDTLPPKAREGKEIYFICASGGRSQKACELIESIGSYKGVNVQGGTNAAVKVGLPIKNGKPQGISLERQVRIGAGAITLIGVFLGLVLHEIYFLICVFVGAGLLYSGISNWCGMALLLEKMPWNLGK